MFLCSFDFLPCVTKQAVTREAQTDQHPAEVSAYIYTGICSDVEKGRRLHFAMSAPGIGQWANDPSKSLMNPSCNDKLLFRHAEILNCPSSY